MTKAELVERIAHKINLTKKDTERVVNLVFGSIMNSLAEGDKVELRGFGSFRVRVRNSRDGRNPRTGERVSIPAKKAPFFKAGKDLRELVDQSDPLSFEGDGAPAPAESGAWAESSKSDSYL